MKIYTTGAEREIYRKHKISNAEYIKYNRHTKIKKYKNTTKKYEKKIRKTQKIL